MPTASPASRSRTTTPRPTTSRVRSRRTRRPPPTSVIIDPKIVSDTFSQLQQYRQYYQFPEGAGRRPLHVKGETEDTVIAVRDIDLAGLSSAANTQYNWAFVYTHGYGVVAAYGNQRASDGKPVFLESGHPVERCPGRLPAARVLRRDLAALLDRGCPEGHEGRRARLPVRLRRRQRRQRDHHVRRRRRSEPRQLLQPARLRREVPVGADPALERCEQGLADPLRPRPDHPRAEGRAVPDRRQ